MLSYSHQKLLKTIIHRKNTAQKHKVRTRKLNGPLSPNPPGLLHFALYSTGKWDGWQQRQPFLCRHGSYLGSCALELSCAAATSGTCCHCCCVTEWDSSAHSSSELNSETRGEMASQWDSLTTDFNSGMWMAAYCQQPFLNAQFKGLVEERGGAPWKVLDVGCGMGQHTIKLLQAGASYVLAFDASKDMVEGAKLEMNKFLQTQALPEAKVDFVVASATDCSSIPGAQEGTFDLAICIYVLCNLLSKEEVKRALAEIYKLLKPGGKLMIYETHIIQYLLWNDESVIPLLYKWGAPKEDGTTWGYFEDEGKPREVRMRMNSGRMIKFTNRLYTLSSWVSLILEAGFQITQFFEPHVDPKAISADAPDYMKFAAGKPMEMCWECTKPKLSQ